jgi:hypothetical protein
MNIKIFIAAAVVSLTAACAPTTETIEVAAGPEAQAALNTANASEAVSDSEATPQAFSRY